MSVGRASGRLRLALRRVQQSVFRLPMLTICPAFHAFPKPRRRLLRVVPAAVFVLLSASALAGGRKAPPVPDVNSLAARDAHPKEQVTVAVEPFETRSKADFFRLDYPGHSLLPVRVVIRNDSEHALDLNDVRIQFIAADGTKLPAATPDEINRRLFRFKDIQPKHIPGTPITYHSTPVDKKILDDDKDFGFSQTTVAPHTTASGFLFYDIKDVDDPPLRHAELYVKQMHSSDGKRTELFAFTLPFDKYLNAEKPATKDDKAAGKDDSRPATDSGSDKP